MKNPIARRIGLGLALFALSPGAARADAIITWSENALKAARAACVIATENGLAEARMYAMMHAAVHDAVNAIDRRSRPYAFDGRHRGRPSITTTSGGRSPQFVSAIRMATRTPKVWPTGRHCSRPIPFPITTPVTRCRAAPRPKC